MSFRTGTRRPQTLTAFIRRPTVIAAVVFAIGASVSTFAYWHVGPQGKDWIPNIATDLGAIAVTLTLVEWILGREARRQIAPWRNRVLWDIGFALREYVRTIAQDYAATHLHNYRPIPVQMMGTVDLWLAEVDTNDAGTILEGKRLSLIVHRGVELGQTLKRIRERDERALEPSLIAAIDDFLWRGVGHGQLFYNRAYASQTGEEWSSAARLGEKSFVEAAKHLIEVYDALRPEHPIARDAMDDLTIRAMAEHNETLRSAWMLQRMKEAIERQTDRR